MPRLRLHRGFLAAAAVVLMPAAASSEERPVYKGREPAAEPAAVAAETWGEALPERPLRPYPPPRPYAGSAWGLGKPSFYGIGPRPDPPE